MIMTPIQYHLMRSSTIITCTINQKNSWEVLSFQTLMVKLELALNTKDITWMGLHYLCNCCKH